MSGWAARLGWYIAIPVLWLFVIGLFLYSSYVPRWFSARERSISIFFWADIIPQRFITQFEQETGIKVYVNYYEGNDELLTKLQFTRGVGYDIIMPSNYMVEPLVQAGFLKKIDKKRLPFWSELDKRLVGHAFDADNTYTVPYIWDVYGLGVDTAFFEDKQFQASWRMLFNPAYPYRVGMTDEPREIIAIASQYLFGHVRPLTEQEAVKVERLLVSQKKFVEAYTDLALDTLLVSKTCPIVLGPGANIARARRRDKNIRLVLPQEGSVSVLESFALAKNSVKDDLVYQFINFVCQKHIVEEVSRLYGYLPCLRDSWKSIDLSYIENASLLSGDYFKRIALIRPLLPRDQLVKLWLAVKAY